MRVGNIGSMTNGWFMGSFEPTMFRTNAAEAAIKRYLAGDYESAHHHKIATEITVIVTGKVRMNSKEFIAGDIIIIEPFEETDFLALEDSITVVIKCPGALQDKYVKA